MNTEKRGSEKLKELNGKLCALTDEELEQVSGGVGPRLLISGDVFPLGILPPYILREMSALQQLEKPIGVQIQDDLGQGPLIGKGF